MTFRLHVLPALCFLAGAGWFATRYGPGDGEEAAGQTPGIPARPGRPWHAGSPEQGNVAAAMAPIRAAGDRWAALKAAIDLAHRIPPEEISRWLDAGLFKHPDDILTAAFYRTLRDRFLEIDPIACLTGMRERQIDHNDIWEYARRWAMSDPRAALQAADERPDLRGMLFGHALTALAGTDPAAVFARLDELQADRNLWSRLDDDSVFQALAAQDSLALLERSRTWQDDFSVWARESALCHWAKKDTTACLAWLAKEPDGEAAFLRLVDGYEVGKSLVRHLHELPPGWVAALGESDSFHNLTQHAGEAWLAADLEGAGMTSEQALKVRVEAVGDLARNDIAKAIAAYRTLEGLEDGARRDLINKLAPIFADRDAVQARQWAETLDDPFREAALVQISGKEAPRNLSEYPVAEVFQQVIEGKLRRYQVSGDYWSPRTTAEAVEAVRALSPEGIRRLAEDSGYLSHPVSAEIVDRRIADGLSGPDMIRSTASTAAHWASEDPAAVSRWVTTLPEGEARRWAVLNLAAGWNRDDPAAVAAWIDGLASETDRAAAREGVESLSD